jgi:hypothetical protein
MLRRAWTANKPLTAVGLSMGLVLATAIVGLVVDHTVITGAPAWVKPTKFAISIAIYSFTFLWLLSFVDGHRRVVRTVSWATAIAFWIEMVLIAAAAAEGTTSHFNLSTPLHSAIWFTMAGAIVVAFTANLAALILLLRQHFAEPAFAWSLRMGLLISAVGMGVAFLMTSPTPQQLAAAHAGGGMPISGAHTVGAPDGGPGLPFLGWSTIAGDLRIPHFIGLHGLQVLPLIGALIIRYAPAWLSSRDRVTLVITAAAGYLGLVGLTTWQALRGQSLIHPDATMLSALAALVAVVAGVALAVVAPARVSRTARA